MLTVHGDGDISDGQSDNICPILQLFHNSFCKQKILHFFLASILDISPRSALVGSAGVPRGVYQYWGLI